MPTGDARPRAGAGPGAASRRRRPVGGYTWPLLLFLLALTAAGLGAAADTWWAGAQAEREREWSWRGEQYARALDAWAAATPDGAVARPRTLEQLLIDDRLQPARHHLRRLYPDPWTGRADWLIVRAADGGIVGLRSRSPRLRTRSDAPDSPSARAVSESPAREPPAGHGALTPTDPRRVDAWWFAAGPLPRARARPTRSTDSRAASDGARALPTDPAAEPTLAVHPPDVPDAPR